MSDSSKKRFEIGEWNGKRIRVNPQDADYFNATDMCRSCGRQWHDYFRLEDTQEFIDELSLKTGIPVFKMAYSSKGRYGGTWIYIDVALDLARWLDKKFHVQMIQWTKQLMKTGSVIIHREHQEAQLHGSPQSTRILHEILSEVKHQRVENHEILSEVKYQRIENRQILDALQQKPIERVEAVVQDQLVREEGGITNVKVGRNDRIDVLQEGRHIVEVKEARNWKAAAGQAATYSRHIADATKRVHLFFRPHDKPFGPAKIREIEESCGEQGIRVTWHKWSFQPLPEQQLLLPLGAS